MTAALIACCVLLLVGGLVLGLRGAGTAAPADRKHKQLLMAVYFVMVLAAASLIVLVLAR
ncbi:hypothetical protein [Streptomyces zingiberis]|uniref:Twin transmembrane helix small protein n=1 Tax=Streptomyces zingiberis TaxID=2053010 RepID=A0ABX1BXL9_9ACTN|nr:hypothetical protein [Streptomyces zingiberis]NJQ01235.1 hypothetical protein [Streptomyces zingiberis]